MFLFYALISAFIVSLLAFLGLTVLAVQEKKLDKILIYLVSFSAGGLLGGAFFHLLPEAVEESPEVLTVFVYALIGFCLFFVMEKFLRWHHCHDQHCQGREHLGYMNLVGDGLHNVLDGIIIISSFMVSFELGVVVSLSIIFHEIPQELGDFGVLLYAGFNKLKALLLNYLVAFFTVIGVLIGYLLISLSAGITFFLVPAAAGGFIYIAASDLIPELHKHIKPKLSILSFLIFIISLLIMYLLKNLEFGA